MKKIVILLLLFCCTNVYSQTVRKYSNEFLKIGVGGNYLGMGGSLVASKDDLTSVFYNPAGISNIESVTIGAMHNSYFAGIANYDYAGVILPFKEEHKLGVSFIRLGVDDIPNTLQLYNPDGSINYDNITSFSIADMALFFTYARNIGISGLSIGSNVKIINRRYGEFANAYGFGIDVGAQILKDDYRIGLFAQDLTTTFSMWSFSFSDEDKQVLSSTGNEIPTSSNEITVPSIHLGGAKDFKIAKGNIKISPSAKLSLFMEQRNVLISGPASIDVSLGNEIIFWDIAMLRMGVNNFTTATNVIGEEYMSVTPSLGVGFKFDKFQIDYSYNNVANNGIGLYSHSFTVSYKFKKKAILDTRPTIPQQQEEKDQDEDDEFNPFKVN